MVEVDGIDLSFPLAVDEGDRLSTVKRELDEVPVECGGGCHKTVDMVR
jgi:hypothetical protein